MAKTLPNKLPKVTPIVTWPKPPPNTTPYIKRIRKDGNPDESGDRAR